MIIHRHLSISGLHHYLKVQKRGLADPIFIVMLLALPVAPVHSATLDPGVTFANTTPDPGDQFGLALADADGKLLVTSPLDDAGAIDAGAAYLFNATTGTLLLTFLNPSPGPDRGDQFGRAVATVGNNILIGSAFDDTKAFDSGAAYLFDSNTGQLIRSLYDPNPAPGDGFGRAVAALGDNILIGAHEKDVGPAIDAGVVYLFDVITGSLIRTFQNPDPASGDNFGRAVASMGNNVIIGAPLDDTAGPDTGTVYLFDGSTGNLIRGFPNPTPAFEDEFGLTIEAAGNIIIVGAHQADAGRINSGAVHLFDSSTGSLVRTILNPTPADGDKFGRSIAIIGNGQVLVGAPFDGTNALEAGSAYLFDLATGQLLQSFHNPTPAARDRFGWSVMEVSGSIAIGAPFDDTDATDSGVVYLYGTSLQPPPPLGSDPPSPIYGLPSWVFYGIVAALVIEVVVVLAVFWRRRKQKTQKTPLPPTPPLLPQAPSPTHATIEWRAFHK